jgi:CheY-like chemotaxis protein
MVNILVIDDDDTFRDWIASILRRRGYQVAALSSLDAINTPPHEGGSSPKFDVAIVDMIMPEMDGIETIRALRARWPLTKIVAMSGGGRQGDTQFYLHVAERFGAVAGLTKPFMASDLNSAISRALRSAGGSRR